VLRSHKSFLLSECEFKFAKDDSGFIEAYASVFDGVDSYGDTIHKGAYARTIKENPRPYFNFAHRDDRPMGPISEIKEDGHGLWFRAGFTKENSDSQNIRASVADGTLTGLSIEFRPYPGGATPKDDNSGGYDLTDIKLRGIAIVAYPADDAARVIEAKSEIQAFESLSDVEHFLRDAAKLTRSEAREFVARFKSLCPRDADATNDEITRLKEKLAQFEARASLTTAFERNRQLLQGFIQ
jgi:hypothetical protein